MPADLAVDSTNAYWVSFESGDLVQVGLCGGKPVTLATGSDGSVGLGIAVDSTDIYWLTYVPGAHGWHDSTLTLAKIPIAGGDTTTLSMQPYAFQDIDMQNIAVDSARVYWSNRGAGTVLAIPIGGGTESTLASGQVNPISVAVDAPRGMSIDSSNVYFTTLNTVASVPKGGGAATTVHKLNDGGGTAVNGMALFWTDTGGPDADGTVARLTPP
jgi:hypothetical protein